MPGPNSKPQRTETCKTIATKLRAIILEDGCKVVVDTGGPRKRIPDDLDFNISSVDAQLEEKHGFTEDRRRTQSFSFLVTDAGSLGDTPYQKQWRVTVELVQDEVGDKDLLAVERP